MSCINAQKCSIDQLPIKLRTLAEQRLSPQEEIIVCYLCEMRDPGFIFGIGARRYYQTNIITKQAVFYVVDFTSYVRYINLVDVVSVEATSTDVHKYCVNVKSRSTTQLTLPLTSREASLELASTLQHAVNQAKSPKSQVGGSKGNPADRLKQLQQLLNEGLINQQEYDQTRKEILRSL